MKFINKWSRGAEEEEERGQTGPSRGQYAKQEVEEQKNAAALFNGILKERRASPTTHTRGADLCIHKLFGALWTGFALVPYDAATIEEREREKEGPVNCGNLGQPEAVFSWRRFSSVAKGYGWSIVRMHGRKAAVFFVHRLFHRKLYRAGDYDAI